MKFPMSGWKTYLAAAAIAITAFANYYNAQIDMTELITRLGEALAVVGFRDVIGRFAKG